MQIFLLIFFHYLSISYCSNLSGLNLHHTDHVVNGSYHDCLYYNIPPQGLVSQLIQYCIRFYLDEELTNPPRHHPSFTFEELRKKNVTGFQLYTWSAPIDIVEHYEIYLENVSSTNILLYYNCTYPWFGSRCEYIFDYPQSSFARQVKMNFDVKNYAKDDTNLAPPSEHFPCYTHLKCNRVSDHGTTAGACLDWREICDGKVDCIDGGQDEEQCWQLEINECDSETEFRCHNGLCIPFIFLNDDKENADCLDRTDEPHVSFAYTDYQCNIDPGSRCEDHTFRPIENSGYMLECGNGARISPFAFDCSNMRNFILIKAFFTEMNVSDVCRSALYCIMGWQLHWTGLDEMPSDCDHNKYHLYAALVKEHCPSLVEFPPILFGHVHFIYTNDQFVVSKSVLNICAFELYISM